MPVWRQWAAIYLALFIGGIASIHFHFIDYIWIVLAVLGLLAFTSYHEQVEHNKLLEEYYEMKEKEEGKIRLDKSRIAKEILDDFEHDFLRTADDSEGFRIGWNEWESFKAKYEE